MMKRLFAVILCAVLFALTFTACGGSQTEAEGTSFFVRDEHKHDSITATFISTESDASKEIAMTKTGSTGDFSEFTCKADPDVYDRVILNTGSEDSIELAFNRHVIGWVLTSQRAYPYDSGYEAPVPKRQTFDYENRKKDVLIWTPDDYDPSSDTKYAVIYMPDGQNLFNRSATSTGSWGVAESARAMLTQSNIPCIIVGIETDGSWRDNELTPDLGGLNPLIGDEESSYKDGHGGYFCDFVVNTVMPYVEENYNVYTDREHTHICGSSSGGIESFYIAMEHPERFGSVGALSPAFLLYSDESWVKYLSEKDFSAGYPTVYLYCGNNGSDQLEQSLYYGTVAMPKSLKKVGYPEDKVVTKLYDDGGHKEVYWRVIFPDYLKYAFPIENTSAK